MRTLREYILEKSQEVYRLTGLKVVYKCAPLSDHNRSYVSFEVPNEWDESNIMQYLDDLFLGTKYEFPQTKIKDLGQDNVYDTYFSYDRYEKDNNKEGGDIKYEVEDDKEICKIKIYGLRYHLEYDTFDLKDVDDNNLDEEVSRIFDTTISNDTNKYPMWITIDKIEFER